MTACTRSSARASDRPEKASSPSNPASEIAGAFDAATCEETTHSGTELLQPESVDLAPPPAADQTDAWWAGRQTLWLQSTFQGGPILRAFRATRGCVPSTTPGRLCTWPCLLRHRCFPRCRPSGQHPRSQTPVTHAAIFVSRRALGGLRAARLVYAGSLLSTLARELRELSRPPCLTRPPQRRRPNLCSRHCVAESSGGPAANGAARRGGGAVGRRHGLSAG